jgi:hypothetical protein
MKLQPATARIAWVTRREIMDGEVLPSNHAWGTDHLFAQGARRVPTHRVATLDRLGEHLRLGPNITEQIWLFLHPEQYDCIIAKDTDLVCILCGLLSLTGRRKPIHAFLHFPLRRSLKDAWLESGCSTLLALSDKIQQLSLVEHPGAAAQLATVPWGVDVPFYDRLRMEAGGPAQPENGRLKILLNGITGRSFSAFVEALAGDMDVEVRVLTDSAEFMAEIQEIPNFSSIRRSQGQPVPYRELVDHLVACDVVALPLNQPPATDAELIAGRATLWGITALLEAAAVGRPVLMTRNPLIDLDLEAEQCGRFVETADATGWRESVQWCLANRAALPEMGARARRHVLAHRSMEEFQSRLQQIIESRLDGS